jgi:pilus assembly protein Flp/PilA
MKTRRLIMKFFKNLLRNEAGATAIEYGLIAALIAVAAITAMQTLGSQLSTTFNEVATDMQGSV